MSHSVPKPPGNVSPFHPSPFAPSAVFATIHVPGIRKEASLSAKVPELSFAMRAAVPVPEPVIPSIFKAAQSWMLPPDPFVPAIPPASVFVTVLEIVLME